MGKHMNGFLLGFGLMTAFQCMRNNASDRIAHAMGAPVSGCRDSAGNWMTEGQRYEDWKMFGPRMENGYYAPTGER